MFESVLEKFERYIDKMEAATHQSFDGLWANAKEPRDEFEHLLDRVLDS